ncbi:MAG TPA: ROK family transcriptional regulator [Chloroflexia bacterium]|nr:ROK family transcriptional regulator [Chloroflexia bacterium]
MTYTPKGDRFLTKEINRNLVLNIIKTRGPISRKDVADVTGLSPATVTGITAILIEDGLVSETGEGRAGALGGRKPILLQLNPQAGFVAGVKIIEEGIVGVLVDLDATVIYKEFRPLARGTSKNLSLDPAITIQTTIETIEEMLSSSSIPQERVLGIGVGINGLVDTENGVCRFAPHFGWHNIPIKEPLVKHFDLPVHLSNDVKSLTLAEQWFGTGQNVDNFVVVAIGRGIGAGIVANGQFYGGTLDGAGEFGHMVLVPGGPRCSCGKKGCLEALAAEPGILRQVRVALAQDEPTILAARPDLSLKDLAQAAEMGDALAQRILTEAGEWLGLGIAHLLNILSPSLIIFTGEGVQAGPLYYDAAREAIAKYTFSEALVEKLSMVVEPLSNVEWARGAACTVLSDYFMSPVYKSSVPAMR